MWNVSSSSSSCSTRFRNINARRRRKRSLMIQNSCLFQDSANGAGEAAPIGGLHFQLLAPGSGQMVEARAAAQLGNAPFGFDPTLMLQTVQRRIKRALIDLQNLFGDLLDAFGNSPAVQRAGLQRPEDQEIESALKKIHGVECRQQNAILGVECQQQSRRGGSPACQFSG